MAVEYRKLIPALVKRGGIKALRDAFDLCRSLEREGSSTVIGGGDHGTDSIHFAQENFEAAHRLVKDIRKAANELVRSGTGGSDALDLYYRTHLFDAPYNFDSFCLYIEKDREPKKRFYLPRRKQLLPCALALQDLEDDKLDLLGISEPPGIGKTTLAEFFLAWKVGRSPFLPNLVGSHNNAFLSGMYGEMLRIMDSRGEYRWADVFPGLRVIATNAKDLMIGVGYNRTDDMRFKSLEFTSIGAGNAGKVRAMGVLYCDDLVSDIEQALSKDRLDKLWQQYTTDLRQRKVGDRCKELHIATRWSLFDILGRLEQEYENDPRARFIRFPALNEDDESNFDYPYGLGYTTDALHKQHDIMDDASWKALFMNEPVEREGQLYSPEELRRYFTLPEQEPDTILAICDTKEQGADYCVCPVFYQYGNDFYMDAIICDNGKVEIVQERVAKLLVDKKVRMCRIESNRGGTLFAQNVEKRVKEMGGLTSITTKWTQSSKDTRIQINSATAKARILFKDESLYAKDKEYRDAMGQLCSYSMMGKNKHDDVPDAIAMFVDWQMSDRTNIARILKRPY